MVPPLPPTPQALTPRGDDEIHDVLERYAYYHPEIHQNLVPRKGCSEKFCQHCKAHGSPFTTYNTLDCRHYDSNGKPLEVAAGKPSKSKKPYKKSGGIKGMAFMQSMFKAYLKNQKKAGKSKKCKKRDYDSSDSSDSE